MAYTKFTRTCQTIVMLLSAHPVFNYNESIAHLKALAQLVDIFAGFAGSIGEAEAEMFYSTYNVEKTLKPWEHVISASDAHRRRYPGLEPTLELITFAIGIRGTVWIQTLPTPVRAEEKAIGYTWVWTCMLPAAFAAVKRFIATSHEYPRYQLLLTLIAISATRRCAQFYSLSGGDAPHGFDFGEISKAEAKMYAMGGGVARALHKVQDAFKDEPRHLVRNADESVEADLVNMFDPNDLSSLFNMDFSSWDSLFGGFATDTATMSQDMGVHMDHASVSYPNGSAFTQ